jgi:molybdopterin-guanine dinucleotide biosynthesis protein A
MSGRADITLAVLAGGRGERMGGPKSALIIRGEPILKHLLTRLKWEGPTLLVTSPGNERPAGAEAFDREVTDAVASEGPLRGVLTALEASSTDLVAVVTVDMPAVTAETLTPLLEFLSNAADARGVLFGRTVGGRILIEPFPSVFRQSLSQRIGERLKAGHRSMHGLVEERVERVAPPGDWPDDVWTNLNRPEDLARFLQK